MENTNIEETCAICGGQFIYGESLTDIIIPPEEDFIDNKTNCLYLDFKQDGKDYTVAFEPSHLLSIFYSIKPDLMELDMITNWHNGDEEDVLDD